MFFLSSKFIWAFIAPSSLMIGMICINALLFALNKNSIAKRMFFLSVTVFLIIGCTPLMGHLSNKWDSQYPLVKTVPDDIEGVIILGGAIDIKESARQDRMVLNAFNHSRITALTHLLRNHQNVVFLYSGGNSYISSPLKHKAESHIAESYMRNIYSGAAENLLFETQSKNTYQNAVMSKALYLDQISVEWPNKKPWLLVTSAYHMPRAQRVFEKQGWKTIPYPANHSEKAAPFWQPTAKFWDNWIKIDVLAHEVIGIIAYSLTHKI